MFVLITAQKQRLIISQKEYDALLDCLNKGQKFVVIQNHLMSLAIAPSVTPFASWYATENERLANSGKRLCRKCLKQMEIMDKCSCWTVMGKGKIQEAFVLSDEIKKFIADYSKKFSWPKLLEEENMQIEIEEAARIPQYVERSGHLGYIDEESGEELYT